MLEVVIHLCYNNNKEDRYMTTISIRSSEQTKDFLKRIAEFNGMSLSEYILSSALEKAELQADYQEYLQIIENRNPEEDITFEEMEKELGL